MPFSNSHLDSLLPPLKLNRRGFIATAVSGGFALAAGPVAAQTVVKTGAEGLTAGMVSIPAADREIPAYRAAPAGKTNLPTVLVVPEIFGVHEYIQDVCRRLARQGYLAIAPDPFVRQGDPTQYSDIPRILSEVVMKVPDAQVMADLDAASKWAAANGGDPAKLGILGFCWGGRAVWLYSAHNPKLKAGVAFYGNLRGRHDPQLRPRGPVDIAAQLHAPVQGAYGGKDAGISLEDVAAMREALAQGSAAARASVIDVYPDAGHAFHADYRPSYREAEAKQAWQRMLDWFGQHGLK